MKKKYTIQGLADILGCSRVAISKKITTVDNVTGTKLFKKRYDVVIDNGIMHILLDDAELENEKRLSKGFKNVSLNGYETTENENIIDVEPIETKKTQSELLEFTERYIEDFKTFQKDMYQELRNRDSQILLLTTSEKDKEKDYLQVKAENKTLRDRNRIVTWCLAVITTLLIIVATSFITFIAFNRNVEESSETTVTTVEKVTPQKTKETAPTTVKAVKKHK